jgi:predicted RNA-binding Zn-ribbon protein involved in translation (DUF1610 family)
MERLKMTLKENGKTKSRKSHKVRTYKCSCGKKIDIDERIELEDFDLVGKDQYVFFCPYCGDSSDIKRL